MAKKPKPPRIPTRNQDIETLTRAVKGALKRGIDSLALKFGSKATALGQVQVWIGCSGNTVRNWYSGRTVPDAATLLVLARRSDFGMRAELVTLIRRALPGMEEVELLEVPPRDTLPAVRRVEPPVVQGRTG